MGIRCDSSESLKELLNAFHKLGFLPDKVDTSRIFLFYLEAGKNFSATCKKPQIFDESISHLDEEKQTRIYGTIFGSAVIYLDNDKKIILFGANLASARNEIARKIESGKYISFRESDEATLYVTNNKGEEFLLPHYRLNELYVRVGKSEILESDSNATLIPRHTENAPPGQLLLVAEPEPKLLPALFPDTAYQQQCLIQTYGSLNDAARLFKRIRQREDQDTLILDLIGLRSLSVALRGSVVDSVLNPNHEELAGIFGSLLPTDYSNWIDVVNLNMNSWAELPRRAEEFRIQVLEVASLPAQILGFVDELRVLVEALSNKLSGTGSSPSLSRLQEIALLLDQSSEDQKTGAENASENITVIIEEAQKIVRNVINPAQTDEQNHPGTGSDHLGEQRKISAAGRMILDKLEEVHRSLLQLKRDQQQPHIIIRVPDGLHSPSSGGRGTYDPIPPTVQACLERARTVYGEMSISDEAITSYVESLAGRNTLPRSRTAAILSSDTGNSASPQEAQLLVLISEQIVAGDIRVIQGRNGIRMLLPTAAVLGDSTKLLETDDGLGFFQSNRIPGLRLERDSLGAIVGNTAGRLDLNAYLGLFTSNQPAVTPVQPSPPTP